MPALVMTNNMGKIIAVNRSKEKGTPKERVHKAKLIEDWGLEGDAHAGKWHRQVSLLPYERFAEQAVRGIPVKPGSYGENLLVSGFDLKTLPVGTRLRSGEVLLEVTQIGKKCHSGCVIYQETGDCIMPREGIFARVLHGGEIAEGDELQVEQD